MFDKKFASGCVQVVDLGAGGAAVIVGGPAPGQRRHNRECRQEKDFHGHRHPSQWRTYFGHPR
jgi:hypothetical protein